MHLHNWKIKIELKFVPLFLEMNTHVKLFEKLITETKTNHIKCCHDINVYFDEIIKKVEKHKAYKQVKVKKALFFL